MKKIIVLLIASLLVLSMVACSPITITIGGQKEEPTEKVEETQSVETSASKNEVDSTVAETSKETTSKTSTVGKSAMTTDEFYTFIQDYVDISHFSLINNTATRCYLSLDSQYAPEYRASKDIQLFSDLSIKIENDTIITLPMKTSELIKQGWQFKDAARQNGTLDAECGDVMCYFVKGGKEIRVTCSNYDSVPVKYTESTITDLRLEFYNDDYNYANELPSAVAFDIDGKINRESNLKSIIETIGEPSYEITYSLTGNTDQNTKAEIELKYMDIGSCDYCFRLSGDGSTLVGVDIIATSIF